MSPYNLNDVESYLIRKAKELSKDVGLESRGLVKWLEIRFEELRLREKAVLEGYG